MYRHSCRILASLSSAPPRVNALEPFADRSLIARCFCAGAVYDRSVTAAVVLAIAAQPPAIVPLAGAVVLMRSPNLPSRSRLHDGLRLRAKKDAITFDDVRSGYSARSWRAEMKHSTPAGPPVPQ